MQEFFVANNKVDILRNQVTRENEVISLEPKVLEVLRVLAKHAGKVVSHQTLLDTVWPDIVVAPNALQRCIGQLRKALNDDGKSQKVIATHPKRGYSLIAPISFHDSTQVVDEHDVEILPLHMRKYISRNALLWLTVIVITASTLFFISIEISEDEPSPLQQFTRLSPLTATDASEFYSTFSPNGRYVAFSRKFDSSQEHMWLLDRETGKEHRLTAIPGRYAKPVWSTDGKHIAFLETNSCEDNCTNRRCEDIDVIFVPLALNAPQPANKILECAPIPFLGLDWIDNDHLAAIFNTDTSSEIKQVNSQSGLITSLYQAKQATLYSLSFSPANKLLAIMQTHTQKKPSMLLFSTINKDLKELTFTSPKRYNSNLKWAPVWDNTGEHLLFSASSNLYRMDLQGNLHHQRIPTFEDISYPMFHPNGKSIAMTLGKVDTDVAELTFTPSHDKALPYSFIETSFARSILRESNAQYQPNGNTIAFFSKRGGDRQVWLFENNQISQLSHIEEFFPEHFVWSPNGKQIAVSTERELMLFDLKGNVQSLALPFAAHGLFQWLPNNELLMQVNDKQGPKLVSFSIAQNSYRTLHNASSLWAQSNDETVWWVDNDKQLKALNKDGIEIVDDRITLATNSGFFLRNQRLVMLSNEDDIWQLNLKTQSLSKLFHHPNSTVRLTDVSENGEKLLISKQLSAKKEIVLLTP